MKVLNIGRKRINETESAALYRSFGGSRFSTPKYSDASFAKSGYLSPERSTYQARRTLLMRLITATISATRTITTATI
jgi:hypothetical protein